MWGVINAAVGPAIQALTPLSCPPLSPPPNTQVITSFAPLLRLAIVISIAPCGVCGGSALPPIVLSGILCAAAPEAP